MAKTIKFNLICDGSPVRTLDDLRNNFCIDDMLGYYNNGLLHRWLDVRGYGAELEKLTAVRAQSPVDIAKELIRIFDVETDEKKIEESVLRLEYDENRQKKLDEYEKKKYKSETVMRGYQEGYQTLVHEILDHPDDAPRIKAAIGEITQNYAWALHLNRRNLFNRVAEKSPLAVMCMLMNERCRKYYLPVEEEVTPSIFNLTQQDILRMANKKCNKYDNEIKTITISFSDDFMAIVGRVTGKPYGDLLVTEKKDRVKIVREKKYVDDNIIAVTIDYSCMRLTDDKGNTKKSNINTDHRIPVMLKELGYIDTNVTRPDTERDPDKKEMFDRICNMINDAYFDQKLGKNLKVFAGNTKAYWKDLEPKSKKLMIISMDQGDFVRPQGNPDYEYGRGAVLNQFLIMDGIDYKSNDATHELRYMEV